MIITKKRLREDDDVKLAGQTLGQKVDGGDTDDAEDAGLISKKTADKTDKVLGDDTDVYSGPGDIENALDDALETNMDEIDGGGRNFQNVLFVGEAGTGKTSRIKAWARKNHINLVVKLAATMDETDLQGALAPNMEKLRAVRLRTNDFDALGAPRSVLFLDEWNRAPTNIRGTLLTLIQDHTIPDPDGEGGVLFLPNFLFTVAAVNPSDGDYNVTPLDSAEKGRMRTIYVAADPLNTMRYIQWECNKKIAEYKKQNNAESPRRIKKFIGIKNLATKILSDPRFSFDDGEDIRKSLDDPNGNGLLLNPRTLTNCLLNSKGKAETFISIWNEYCNSHKKQMIVDILKDYKDVDDKANSVFDNPSDSVIFKDKAAVRRAFHSKITQDINRDPDIK